MLHHNVAILHYYAFNARSLCSLLVVVELLGTLDIFSSSNQIIHKISFSLYFWAPDPLLDRFYKTLSNNRSEAQKQRLVNEIL